MDGENEAGERARKDGGAEDRVARYLEAALRALREAEGLRAEEHRALEERARELETQLLQFEQGREDFLALASHELRTPLTSVLGFLELLSADFELSAAEEREFVESALHSARELQHVIEDLMEVAELESGAAELFCEPLDLAAAARQEAENQRRTAADKGLDLRVEEPPDELPFALGDARKIQVVIRHLLANAVKFTNSGHISLRLYNRSPEGAPALEIRDTGIGFRPEQRDRILQAFRQAEDSTTRLRGGLGLGLAICSRLVRAMNGQISVHSPGEGLGTRVVVTFPPAPITQPGAWTPAAGAGAGADLAGALATSQALPRY